MPSQLQPANSEQTTAVLGAGAWGTALGMVLARKGIPTYLWGHLQSEVDQLQADREHKAFLPGIPFPDALLPSGDLEKMVEASPQILIAVPSHAFRATLFRLRPMIRADHKLLWATKGIETQSGKLMHQVFVEELSESQIPCVLSGPSFASEVAKSLPTAVTLASPDEARAHFFAEHFHADTFRTYVSRDIVGVELGGAVKNTLAIAAGIADGLGFGANSRAALITRGLAEMFRLGVAMGGKQETLMGLAGVGDLILTCTDNQSRNRRFGLAIAKGMTAEQALASIGQVVEGYKTTEVVVMLAKKMQIDMPIVEQTYQILFQSKDPRTAVSNLLARSIKLEA